MRKFSSLVNGVDVQKACDEVIISSKGYNALHGLLKDALRECGIIINVFLVSHKVTLARRASNEDVVYHLAVTCTLRRKCLHLFLNTLHEV